MTDRRALSIRQPWAWLIIAGHKTVENRTWSTNYRGRLYIHASKHFDRPEVVGLVETIRKQHRVVVPKTMLFFGGIIGHVDLVDVVSDRQLAFDDRIRSPWFTGPFGWILENPTPLPFEKLRGEQSLFTC